MLIENLFLGAPPYWHRGWPGWSLIASDVSPSDVEKAHDVPSYQFEASLRAVRSSLPAFKFDNVDVLTSQRALEKLFSIVAGEATQDFVLHLDLVGCTLVIEDRSARYDNGPLAKLLTRVAHPDSKPQGLQHRDFTLITGPKSKKCRGHFRVLNYTLGPVNCVVRCLAEASSARKRQKGIMSESQKDGNSLLINKTLQHLQTPERRESDTPVGNGNANTSVGSTPDSPESPTRGGATNSSTTLQELVPEFPIINAPKNSTPLSAAAPSFTPKASFQLPGETSKRPLMSNNPYPPQYLPNFLQGAPGGPLVTVQGVTGANAVELKLGGLKASQSGGPNGRSVDAPPLSEHSIRVGAQVHAASRHTNQCDDTTTQIPETTIGENQLTQQRLLALQTENISHKYGLTISPNMAALYLSRTFGLMHVGYSSRGHIETITEQEHRRTMTLWEAQKVTGENLKKLASLLCHLSKLCRERQAKMGKETGLIALFHIDAGGSGVLQIVSTPESFLRPSLPEYLTRAMWSEAVLQPERHGE